MTSSWFGRQGAPHAIFHDGFIAEMHNTTAVGTVIADSTNTVELPTMLNVINEIYNILTT